MNTGRRTLEVMHEAQWYNNLLFSLIQRHLGNNILEVGAGTGNFTDKLLLGAKVTALDLDSSYIKELREKFGEKVISGVGDIEKGKYFFNNFKFDTIVCLNVLEHLENDRKALKNMKNLLIKGGNLILLVPAHKLLFSKFDKELGHFRRYSKKEIFEKLQEEGFKIIEIKYLNWWAAIGWLIFIKIFNKAKMPENPVSIFDKLGKFFLYPEKIINIPFGLSILAVSKK
jgi:2-polyprenyl-3-methyl-5-hydroxy-6-metoxy-1,4-benzoquinol methylase